MNALSHSARLRQKLELLATPAFEASSALWTHSRFVELFPEYLSTVHCSTRASVTLMEAAQERASHLAATDPVAAAMVQYLAKHIPEERHHDEWLLDDLEAVGVPRSEVLSRIPPATVAALVGAQYYWTFHYHPAALLGYLAVLEGYPVSADELDRVIARTGLPRRAFRTLLEHSDLDLDHRDELYQALDDLPLTPRQSTLIAVSAFATLHLATRVIEEIVQQYSSGPERTQPHSGVEERSARRVANSARTRPTSGPRAGSGAERRMR
jgi:pyrroloquinoline quinone (PQQ) biosynthesis protein C